VELTGAFHELIHLVLGKDFPQLDLGEVKVTMVEAVDYVLGAFPLNLRKAAAKTLERKGVKLVFNSPVDEVVDGEVRLQGGQVIPASMVIWTAGVKASGLSAQIGAELQGGGRVQVDDHLRLPDQKEIYVIGDMAESMHKGNPLPQLAGVAMQQGKAVARIISADVRGRPSKPFHYFDRGTMATIGRNAAVVDIRGFTLKGFVGWVTWLTVHLILLVSFRSRVLVLINWAYDYFFYDRPVRLIVRADREPRDSSAPHRGD
jgi:NADH dehydrogenase